MDEIFRQVFIQAYYHGQRWDEGLWRFFELSAVARLFAEHQSILSGPVLDLGCGNGGVFKIMFKHRPDAYGIDSEATRLGDIDEARNSRAYIEVRRESGDKLSFPKAFFGLVFSNSVLEHVPQTLPLLREVYRVLKPNGYFVFTTPHPRLYSQESYYWRKVLSLLGLDVIGRLIAQRECTVYHHVSIFSSDMWQSQLETVGFSLSQVRPYVTAKVALTTSCFGGWSRLPGTGILTKIVSPEARKLSVKSNETAEEWATRCWIEFKRFIPEELSDNKGCGQLIVAAK